jgi:hypothetical protein
VSAPDKIDLPHGSHSANPPYTILEVLGEPLRDRVIAELSQYGFDEFHSSVQVFAPYSQCPPISTQAEG